MMVPLRLTAKTTPIYRRSYTSCNFEALIEYGNGIGLWSEAENRRRCGQMIARNFSGIGARIAIRIFRRRRLHLMRTLLEKRKREEGYSF